MFFHSWCTSRYRGTGRKWFFRLWEFNKSGFRRLLRRGRDRDRVNSIQCRGFIVHFQGSTTVFRKIGLEFISRKTSGRRSYRGRRIRAHASAWAKPFSSFINFSLSSVVIARMFHAVLYEGGGTVASLSLPQSADLWPFSWHLKQRPSFLWRSNSGGESLPNRWDLFRSTSIGTSSRPPDFLGASLPFLVALDRIGWSRPFLSSVLCLHTVSRFSTATRYFWKVSGMVSRRWRLSTKGPLRFLFMSRRR